MRALHLDTGPTPSAAAATPHEFAGTPIVQGPLCFSFEEGAGEALAALSADDFQQVRHALVGRAASVPGKPMAQCVLHDSVTTTEIYLEHLTPDQQLAATRGVAQKRAQR